MRTFPYLTTKFPSLLYTDSNSTRHYLNMKEAVSMDVTGKEMVLDRKAMAQKKVDKIKAGLSAFAETKEVSELIRKQLAKEGIAVHEDVTEVGSWFIPGDKGAAKS